MNHTLTDPYQKLAETLIGYSTKLQKGEKILIEVTAEEKQLTTAILNACYKVGAEPYLSILPGCMVKPWLAQVTPEQLKKQAEWDCARMSEMDAYIGIRVRNNIYEMNDIPEEKIRIYTQLLQHPVHHGIRVPKTKWVILRYPNDSMAQEAKMSTENFAKFYFDVCTMDYAKMSLRMDPLFDLLDKGKHIEIKAPGTHLTFSIEGISAIKCDGQRNIPDGEVYTAPVRDSVEGELTYNTPTTNQGQTFTGVHLVFEKGKIVKAEAGAQTKALNAILDTDEGARYIGEFAFGLNPYIERPMNDILFDEKIHGSFHFTPGACYDEASNGNSSAIHWDMVHIMRSEYGGGEIYCDGVLIQKDGRFCIKDLEGLNPENLK